MKGHNICFHRVIRKSAFKLSSIPPLIRSSDSFSGNFLNLSDSVKNSINKFHTGLWLRTGCVTNAQVSVFERTGFLEKWPISDHYRR